MKKIYFMKKITIAILIVALIFPSIAVKTEAAKEDVSLTSGVTVNLDGTNDGEAVINLVTAAGGSFEGLEGTWNIHETEGTSYFTLAELTPMEGITVDPGNDQQNDKNTGRIVWKRTAGISAAAGSSLWTAKYSVNKDTPAGTYTVKFNINSILGLTAKNDPSAPDDAYENYDLTTTVTVVRPKIQITPEISGYETSYEYTSNQIKPEIVVKPSGEETALVKNTDYTVSYGENTNVGTGSITISPVASSSYNFTETSVNFEITKKNLTESDVAVPATITITGEALSPEVSVTSNNRTLVKDTDYTVAYENQNGNVGENVVVKVTGSGNYQGEITKNVLITAKPQREVTRQEDISLTYGKTRKFEFTDDTEVTFTSANSDNLAVTHTYEAGKSTNTLAAKNAGRTTVTVTYAETREYAETSYTFDVTVEKQSLRITNVTVNNKNYDETTTATVEGDVTFEGIVNNEVVTDTFVKGTDYTVSAVFSDANAGQNKTVTATVTLAEGKAKNYALDNAAFVTRANINKIKILDTNVTLDTTSFAYDGTAKMPTVTVKIGDKTLLKNSDYTVTNTDNINAGTVTLTITGTNNYEGVVTKTYTISKKSITPTVNDIEDVTYNGAEQKPQVIVKNGETTLDASEYTVAYTNNINATTEAKATITAVEGSNYSFATIEKTFTIKKYEVKDPEVSLEYTAVRYNGSEKRPQVTVTVNGHQIPATYYNVSYSNNQAIGIASVNVTMTNANYSGSITKNFEIKDKDVLTISGINDNQSITYTGSDVELAGTITVSANTKNIKASDLTVKYYDNENNEIARPKDVGSYSVRYSFEDEDYIGSLSRNFEIVKASSGNPSEMTSKLTGIVGEKLSTIALSTTGLNWVDGERLITAGNGVYQATYTKNNDIRNYTTETVNIPVYGRKYVNVVTSVQGQGGEVSESQENILEGTEIEITFSPREGYELDKVTVNSREVKVDNNKLKLTVANDDMAVVATYKVITYTVTVVGENVDSDPNGIINVNYNENKEISIVAKDGYKLTSVMIDGKEKINDLANGKLKLTNIKSNIKIIVSAEKIIVEENKPENKSNNNNENNGNNAGNKENKSNEDEGQVVEKTIRKQEDQRATSKLPQTGENVLIYITILLVIVELILLRMRRNLR